ncbi:DUF98 domain-containing protein, partial [Methanothermococcus sp. SCGC AD-155-M21]|nr:DUF98 domain-containing protein [Methanothermococcus sp. SCGC AD-155-M21]
MAIMVKPYRIINNLPNLRNEEKMLLGTDGSVTNLLEILFNHEVTVKTIYQEIVDNINHRSVVLKIKDIPLVYATSKIPLKNINNEALRNSIKRDLLSADIPIGKILKIHNLETRREIKEICCRIGYIDIYSIIYSVICYVRCIVEHYTSCQWI